MSLIRYQLPDLASWSSNDRLASFRDEVNRLLELSPTRDTGIFSGWSPALDVFDEKERFLVTLEVPGVKKEEIHLTIHDGVLSVSGERKQEREVAEGESFRSERYFGKFQRSVTLPNAVDAAKVTASYKDGLLTIDLPKAEEARPKQIEVNVA